MQTGLLKTVTSVVTILMILTLLPFPMKCLQNHFQETQFNYFIAGRTVLGLKQNHLAWHYRPVLRKVQSPTANNPLLLRVFGVPQALKATVKNVKNRAPGDSVV